MTARMPASKPYLLDVNVLIALSDPAHVQHELAHDWFAAHGQHAWATCPITQNGLLRIVGHARSPIHPARLPLSRVRWPVCARCRVTFFGRMTSA